ncbi:M15 family metallopeptidase [Bacillus infantis]|uniref:M15 family metallopeptidase n=1 Tax=Bacillus infantis TaxID=324767 RepID=UPI003219819A
MNLTELHEKAKKRLVGVHPEIQQKALELISRAFSMGIYVIISQGLRTIAEQNELYAQGRTQAQLNAVGLNNVKAKPHLNKVTNAKGGTSYHNFGLAFDFAIANSTGTVIYWDTSIDTNKDGAKDWYQVGKIGQDLGLEWGGVWTSIKDIPHFQITYGLSTADLRNGKKPPEYKIQSITKEENKVDANKLPVSKWAEESWEEATKNGYFDGTRPQANITRQEAAVIVNRLRKNFLALIGDNAASIEVLDARLQEIEKANQQ